MIAVKPIQVHDWLVLKSVRLTALADTPEAFATTLAQAQAVPDEEWQRRAERFAEGLRETACIAYLGETPCGMITCYRLNPTPTGAAEICAMWVAPAFRGQGVGAAMIDAVLDWSQQHDVTTVIAWVADENRKAIAFYERVGFTRIDQHPIFRSAPERNDTLLIQHTISY